MIIGKGYYSATGVKGNSTILRNAHETFQPRVVFNYIYDYYCRFRFNTEVITALVQLPKGVQSKVQFDAELSVLMNFMRDYYQSKGWLR